MRDLTDEEIAAILWFLREEEEKIEETLLSEDHDEKLKYVARLGIIFPEQVSRMVGLTFKEIGLYGFLRSSGIGTNILTQAANEAARAASGYSLPGLKKSIRKRAKKTGVNAKRLAAIIIEGKAATGNKSKKTKKNILALRGAVEDQLHAASMLGLAVIAQKAGILLRFVTEKDAKVCEICRPLDDKIFDFNNAVIPIKDTHPNCRCVLIPFINIE